MKPRGVLVFLKICKILVNARFCGVCGVFHVLMPIQTSLSLAPKLPVFLSSAENCHKFRKMSTLVFLNF